MSLLAKHKKNSSENKNVTVTARITETESEKFTELCKENGFSVSEAIRLLIHDEIYPKSNPTPKPIKRSYVESEIDTDTFKSEPSVEKPSHNPLPAPIKTFNPTTRAPLGRFTTNEWKVNDFLPCPLCNEWVSSTNYARHAKKNHNMSTKEIFTEYKEQADKMVALRQE